jgi:hypothetical protein
MDHGAVLGDPSDLVGSLRQLVKQLRVPLGQPGVRLSDVGPPRKRARARVVSLSSAIALRYPNTRRW